MAGASADELDAWVLATAGRAVAYARSLVADPNDAEDVVQDCFCRLLARSNVYDLPKDGLKLLYRSISNAVINLKTRRRNHRLIRPDGTGQEDAVDPSDVRAIPAEIQAIGNETHSALREALAQLPVQQRAAVELKSLGYSQSEIAEMIGTTPSNAGVLIYRGRQQLAELMASVLSD